MNARAYYNEIDRDAAHVLRALIADGVIAPGDVDERSIKSLAPDRMAYNSSGRVGRDTLGKAPIHHQASACSASFDGLHCGEHLAYAQCRAHGSLHTPHTRAAHRGKTGRSERTRCRHGAFLSSSRGITQ